MNTTWPGARAPGQTIAGDCYYEHTATRDPARAPLAADLDADVVVIGGGTTGLHCALELALRGSVVVVLESARIGAGASGRNGGQLLPGYSCDSDYLVRTLGKETAQSLWAWSVEGMDSVRERAQQADCEYRAGSVQFAAHRRHVAPLFAWYEQLRGPLRYGGEIEFADRTDLPYWSSARNYHAALIDGRAGHLNPLKWMIALARACEAAGAVIFENCAASRIDDGVVTQVHTANATIRCRHVVVAANIFVDGLGLPQQHRIMSVGNAMIATEPLDPDRANGLLRNRFAAYDTNFMLDYYRVTPDNRMLWGGASTYLRPSAGARAGALRQKMLARFPQLADVRIAYSWGGLIDVTASRAPDFGKYGQNVYYLQGFSGHGLNVSAIAGRVVAEAIHGDSMRLDTFARLPHVNFPRAALARRLVLSAGTWYYRLLDQWG